VGPLRGSAQNERVFERIWGAGWRKPGFLYGCLNAPCFVGICEISTNTCVLDIPFRQNVYADRVKAPLPIPIIASGYSLLHTSHGVHDDFLLVLIIAGESISQTALSDVLPLSARGWLSVSSRAS
jgi:hypothetical protein